MSNQLPEILGITGNGSIVAILDDGLDYESRDLADNFVRGLKKKSTQVDKGRNC